MYTRIISTLIFVLLGFNTWGQKIDLDKKKEETIKETVSWEELKSIDGNFRILVPGKMEEKIDSIETDIGKLAYYTYYFQDDTKAENLFYMLSYCDYPAYSVHSDSTEILPDFFEATLESAVGSVDGELLYSDDLNYLHFPGKVWRIDYLEGRAVIKTRAYLIGNRYYSMQIITLKERSLNSASEKFLGSFRLLSVN